MQECITNYPTQTTPLLDDESRVCQQYQSAEIPPVDQELLQSDRPGFGTRTVTEVAFNLVNATVGAGIIGLPYAIYKGGFYTSIGLSVFIAILSQIGLQMLIVAGQRVGIYKYAQLVEYLYGRPGYHFLNFMIVIQASGSCVGYFILVGDTLPVLLRQYLPQYQVFHDRTMIVIVLSVFCVLPLTFFRSIGSLSRWSILSVLCLPVMVFTMMLRAPVYAPSHDAPLTLIGHDVFTTIGIMAFAFACSQVAFSNYLSLKHQSSSSWATTTTIASILSYVSSMAFAFIGYLSFGNDVQPNLFLNFEADDTIVNIGRLFLGISMLLTIPMAFHPTREAVQKSLGFETSNRQPTNFQHYSVTVILFVSIMVVGVSVHSLGKVYSVVGGFAATTLAYILPAAAFIATRHSTVVSDEASKTPLLHQLPPTDYDVQPTDTIYPVPSLPWWQQTAAGLLIAWGVVVMAYTALSIFK